MDSMGRPATISRDALERFLGEGQSYAIARLPGLRAALSWNCGCRAIEHDAGGFTLITCDQHRNSTMRAASMMPFR